MTISKTSLFMRMDRIKSQLDTITKYAPLHDPRVVELSQKLDRLILQFYKNNN